MECPWATKPNDQSFSMRSVFFHLTASSDKGRPDEVTYTHVWSGNVQV